MRSKVGSGHVGTGRGLGALCQQLAGGGVRGGPAAAERLPGVWTVLRIVEREGTIPLGRLISKDKVGKGLPFTPVS